MKLDDVISLLAQGVTCRLTADHGCELVTHHGSLSNEELIYLCEAGFVYSMNGTYRLTDDGRASFFRASDEMQDGVLRAPIETQRTWPGAKP